MAPAVRAALAQIFQDLTATGLADVQAWLAGRARPTGSSRTPGRLTGVSRAHRARRWPARPDHRRGGGRRSPGRTLRPVRCPTRRPAAGAPARRTGRPGCGGHRRDRPGRGRRTTRPPRCRRPRRPRSAQRRRARGRRAGARPGPTGRARTRGSAEGRDPRHRDGQPALGRRRGEVAALLAEPRPHEVRPAAVRVVVDQGAAPKDLGGWPCRQGRGRRWPSRGRT